MTVTIAGARSDYATGVPAIAWPFASAALSKCSTNCAERAPEAAQWLGLTGPPTDIDRGKIDTSADIPAD